MHIPPYQPLQPTEADRDLTLARIRRLRQRKQTMVSVLGLVVIGAGLWQVLPGSEPATSTLTTTASPSRSATATPRASASVLPSGVPVVLPTGVPASSPGVAATSSSTPSASPSASSQSPLPGRTARAPMSAGPVLVSNGSALCTGNTDEAAGGDGQWCLTLQATQASEGLDLQLTACRPTQASSANLTFGSTLETDFDITRAGHLLWRWSAGQSFPTRAHTVSVGQQSQCYSWQTTFGGVDDRGQRLSGDVTVVGRSAAHELVADTQQQTVTL
jgi:hypothetical protein